MNAFRLELEPYPVILGVKGKSEYLRVMEFVHIMHTQHEKQPSLTEAKKSVKKALYICVLREETR